MMLWSARGGAAAPPRWMIWPRSRATFARMLQNDPEAMAARSQDTSTQAPGNAVEAQRGAVGGEGDPFAAFVAAHEAALFGYLWRVTGDEAAAHDLRQETFIRAWQSFATISGYDHPQAWLYRVATNLAFNYRRNQRAHTPLSEITLDPAMSDHTGHVAERDLVRETLLALPPRERAALALREGQGLVYAEVADALNITPAAARTLLWRAREHFRELYDQANPDTTRQGGAQ